MTICNCDTFHGEVFDNGGAVFNFRHPDYGAVGDGVTDDFPAWIRLVDAVNLAGRGVVVIPPGNYRFGQYIVPASNPALSITNEGAAAWPTFNNCVGLRIEGYGARIDVKGDFHRTATGPRASLTPFWFNNCSRFSLAGLEIDGNVDLMTRDAGLNEAFAYGVVTTNCSHYELRDLNLHHFMTDGLALGHSIGTAADHDAIIENVTCDYNARNAVSVMGLDHATFTNCAFRYSTKSVGTYGGHSPGYGVNIEPETLGAHHIDFVNCQYVENGSSQFGAGYPGQTSNIRILGGLLDHGTSAATWSLIFSPVDGVLDGVRILSRNGTVALGYTDTTTSVRARVQMRGCLVEGTHYGLQVHIPGVSALITENELVCTRTAASQAYFPFLEGAGVRFVGNRVYIPKESYFAEVGQADVVPRFYIGECRDNVYETDLDGSTGKHFAVDYGNTVHVENEHFWGANSIFRPYYGSTWPTAQRPYRTTSLAPTQANSAAVDVSGLKADFNALLAKLRDANVLK